MDMAIQTDGKIVVVGYADNGADNDFAMVRYNPDGALDTTFGNGGIVTTDFGADDFGYGLAIQADDKIVVVGNTRTLDKSSSAIAAARYNSDGSQDSTFAEDGIFTLDLAVESDIAEAVAIQTDGRIVLAVESENFAPSDFTVVRLNSDGSLDTSFGGNGVVITAFGPGHDIPYGGLLLQDDGKIILHGITETGILPSKEFDVGVARYDRSGRLDPSFGAGGKVVTDLGTNWEASFAGALQSNGKIVLAGVVDHLYSSSSLDTESDIALLRYNSDGSLDTTFADSGIEIRDLGGSHEGLIWGGLAIQTDGKILAAGYSSGDFLVLRYHSNGSLDISFGNGGFVITDFGDGSDYGRAIAIQADGKIVVAGSAYAGADNDFAVARYNPDGSMDTTFGAGVPEPVARDTQMSIPTLTATSQPAPTMAAIAVAATTIPQIPSDTATPTPEPPAGSLTLTSAETTECIRFEELSLERPYRMGDTVTDSGVGLSIGKFQWSDGHWTRGIYAKSIDSGYAGGSGQELYLNNVNARFDFGGAAKDLSFTFVNRGGNLNIEVNGDLQNLETFGDVLTVGGIPVSVDSYDTDAYGRTYSWRLSLTGMVDSFAIGGQGLVIDDVCWGRLRERRTRQCPIRQQIRWHLNRRRIHSRRNRPDLGTDTRDPVTCLPGFILRG